MISERRAVAVALLLWTLVFVVLVLAYGRRATWDEVALVDAKGAPTP